MHAHNVIILYGKVSLPKKIVYSKNIQCHVYGPDQPRIIVSFGHVRRHNILRSNPESGNGDFVSQVFKIDEIYRIQRSHK